MLVSVCPNCSCEHQFGGVGGNVPIHMWLTCNVSLLLFKAIVKFTWIILEWVSNSFTVGPYQYPWSMEILSILLNKTADDSIWISKTCKWYFIWSPGQLFRGHFVRILWRWKWKRERGGEMERKRWKGKQDEYGRSMHVTPFTYLEYWRMLWKKLAETENATTRTMVLASNNNNNK